MQAHLFAALINDQQTAKVVVITLFIMTYIALFVFAKHRAYIALGSALLLVVLGLMPIGKVFFAVEWNVILMLFGIMGIVALFIESRMPALIGDIIISKAPNLKWAIIILSLLSGIISAFVDNVATVLMIAPIAFTIAKKLDISPVPSIIAIAIASNLQGAATLVGDTTSILLGQEAGMNFFDFFVFQGKLGLFWIVQVSALLATLYLLFIFRKDKQKFDAVEKEKVDDYVPTFLLIGVILALIATSFIPNESKPEITNGLICTFVFVIGLIYRLIKSTDRKVDLIKFAKEIDYMTLLLLTGLFIVIGTVKEAGIIEDIAAMFANLSGNVFVIYTAIVFASVALSAVIDNIPYVAAMLPVVTELAILLGIPPYVLYFGLLSGATLGGNITPIGASANITALGMLRKEGHNVSAGTFMRISVPFTLIAVLSGYAMIWFIYG